MLALLGLTLWVGRSMKVGVVSLQPVEVASSLLLFAYFAHFALAPSLAVTSLGRPSRRLLTGVLTSCVLILVSAAISATRASDVISVLRFGGRYVLGILILTALARFLDRRARLETFERYLLAGALLSVCAAVLGFFTPLGGLTIRYGDRAQAFLNHPNQFAMLLLTLVPIALTKALERPSRIRPWVTVVGLVAGIALTGSKANLLLLAIALPLTMILALELRRRLDQRIALGLGLGVATATIGVVALLIVGQFNPRTLGTLERLFTEPSTTSAVVSRSALWTSAVEIGLEHTWTGVGADNAVYYLPFAHAHNVVLEYFLSLGLPGVAALSLLLVFIALIALACVRLVMRRPGPSHADKLSLLGYALAALFYVASNMSSDSFGGTTLPMLWFVLAMSLARLDLVGRTSSRVGLAT